MEEAETLIKNLSSNDLAEKKKAIFSIGEKKVKQAVPELIHLLQKDEDSVVRNSAARALGKIADSSQFDEMLAALDQALSDPDYYVKTNACWALGKLKDKRAIPSLMKMVDPTQRLFSFGAHGTSDQTIAQSSATEKVMEEGMKFSDIIVSAVKAIGDIRDPSGIPALIKALNDESDGDVRCAAALALGRLKDPSAVLPLIDLLKVEKYWYVRRDIIKALGKFKDPRAAEELVRKLSYMYDDVRVNAKEALVAIGKPAAKYIFKAFLQDQQDQVLRGFISQNLSKTDLVAILEQLISEEDNPSKREKFQTFLTTIQAA